ncbi:MAG: hypothetical protein BEN19_00245 [Epulopiscium sp. Nuni2H_MBin003]|nr:MAG: hypothetical protein BEN19_00245 [Epulopiscium sp. Nuni2H_MBin003]
MRKLWRKGKVYIKEFYQDVIITNIRYEILFLSIIAILGAYIGGNMISGVLRTMGVGKYSIVEYEYYEKELEDIIVSIMSQNYDITKKYETIVNNISRKPYKFGEVYILSGDGQVIDGETIGTENATLINKMNIEEVVKYSDNAAYNEGYSRVYPIVENNEILYLYIRAGFYDKISIKYTSTPDMWGGLVGMLIFSIIMIKGTAKKVRYIEYLSDCLRHISTGDFAYQIDVSGSDQLAQVANDINFMQNELLMQQQYRIELENVKNELITNVAHDLRTPLTSIIGYMGLVKEGRYNSEKEARQYLDIAYNRAEKLKVLLQDLFEYTKLTSKTTELIKIELSIHTMLKQIIDEFIPIAKERGIQLDLIHKDEDFILEADVIKLARVFENLIDNAIKYSINSKVVKVITTTKDNAIYISVRNKTDLTNEIELDKLFTRFYRADKSRNSESGGSGLGLAIAKNIVLLHGGKVWAQLDKDILTITVKLEDNR